MIRLRTGCAGDEGAVRDLLAACDMAGDLDPCECLLAEDAGALAGLARIEHAGGHAYLRPVAVAAAYRGRGVGRMLIETLLAREGGLRIVARGSATVFYEALGFRPLEWEQVDPAFQAECAECGDLGECNPVAMESLVTATMGER